MNKAIFLKDLKALDKKCDCSVCETYTRSYLAHLIRAKEITGMKLLTIHNLYLFNSYVERVRDKIRKGNL